VWDSATPILGGPGLVWDEVDAALLIADVANSTPLYETLGNVEALRRISGCLDALAADAARHGGHRVQSKGDDVLCLFPETAGALAAARAMLAMRESRPLGIHAGLHFGRVVRTRGDVFGDAVNVAARLASFGRPGEVLVSHAFVARLADADRAGLRPLDSILFKGKSAPTRVFVLTGDDEPERTALAAGHGSGHTRTRACRSAPRLRLTLTLGAERLACGEGGRLTIGRAPDCDLVIARPWVSRRHATIAVRHGRVHLSDESFAGTFVRLGAASAFFMRREDVQLFETGTISPAIRPTEPEAVVIEYRIVAEPGPGPRPEAGAGA